MAQGRYWILTIPANDFDPSLYGLQPEGGAEAGLVAGRLPDGLTYLAGQKERGEETGYEHWQLVAYFANKIRLGGVKRVFGRTIHAELSRSDRARQYVFKEETAIEGTRFELGRLPQRRANESDWGRVLELALAGRLLEIEADILVRYYGNLRRIAADHAVPVAMERTVFVYIGPTGTGKSRRAWEEAGMDAYSKSPTSKFWCGYDGQENVVMDEFRGNVDISHLLRWFDRYPLNVEIKGSSVPLKASRIWITSNLDVWQWYPTIDLATLDALKRRLVITYFE